MASAVYLVHYQQPRAHVRHAVRTVTAPVGEIRRLYKHLHEQVIDRTAVKAGIRFVHVRTWMNTGSAFEKKLKNQKHHSRLCPVCNPMGFHQRTTRMKESAMRA